MREKIQTRHPASKRGWRIDRSKYQRARAAMLAALRGGRALTHTELMRAVRARLQRFPGSVLWYAEVVKLDLEARKIIRRKPTRPYARYTRR